MTIELPKPIDDYFIADKERRQNIGLCFTPDAVVKDEGNTYAGIAEIKRWKSEISTKYTYTSDPFSIEYVDGKTIVTSHVVGDFPGSPVDLRYFFEIKGDKIAFLEIIQ